MSVGSTVRRSLLSLVLPLAVAALAACEFEETPVAEAPEEAEAQDTNSEATLAVARVVDGDTIDLEDGTTVRLVQIDAPEGKGECYGRKAARVLRQLLPPGTEVRLRADPKLDDVDRYGRLLRYVFKRKKNINLALVEKGAASVWFYRRERGQHAGELLSAAKTAKKKRRGAWGACEAELTPNSAFETRPKQKTEGPPPVFPESEAAPTTTAPPEPSRDCDPSYPDFCIPSPPPDLDCADIGQSFTVLPPDPHGFDGNDNDGRGCESYG